jgi:hypothetical protein
MRKFFSEATGRAFVLGAVFLGTMATGWPGQAMADSELGNMVFFKGGFMNLNTDRSGQTFADTGGAGGTKNGGNSGWYAGAGLDLLLTKDTWGFMKGASVLGEIGVQFNRIASNRVTNAANVVSGGLGPNQDKVELTMLTIDIAPKIKFMEGSAFRPWIIPIGLDFHVISPPSNMTQYLDLGVQFGGGFEYQVWKAFKLGMDARYHLAANMTNTKNSYFQVGPYVGIAF